MAKKEGLPKTAAMISMLSNIKAMPANIFAHIVIIDFDSFLLSISKSL
jgi:hypothetical protein